jgi:uncharacterized membrane protein
MSEEQEQKEEATSGADLSAQGDEEESTVEIPSEDLADAIGIEDPATEEEVRASIGKAASFSGPFPPPQILDAYNQPIEDGAERIMSYTEREQAHRFEMDEKTLKYYSRGQTFGFVLGLIGVAGGLVIAYEGQGLVGFGAFFSSLASLVGVFMYDKLTSDEAS